MLDPYSGMCVCVFDRQSLCAISVFRVMPVFPPNSLVCIASGKMPGGMVA